MSDSSLEMFQTITLLSSEEVAKIFGMIGFQAQVKILAVCPLHYFIGFVLS